MVIAIAAAGGTFAGPLIRDCIVVSLATPAGDVTPVQLRTSTTWRSGRQKRDACVPRITPLERVQRTEDMNDDMLARSFEQNRPRLLDIASHMLGSRSEADDALQETWLRLSRADSDGIDNLAGWLTTVVGHVCLDMLRSRRARREQTLDASEGSFTAVAHPTDPEQAALLAESVGQALLVILETLAPTERLAFVLHDMFATPYNDIATILGRSPAAARQLASRARRRVRGAGPVRNADLTRKRAIVDAFLAAARDGDFDALLEALDPGVVLRSNGATVPIGGAAAVAGRAVAGARFARVAMPALIDGAVGVVAAADDRPPSVVAFTVINNKISAIDITDDPNRIAELDVILLDAADESSEAGGSSPTR
jgi:RNA polymerase sigma-70 factor (ECF subfamily)